MRPAKIVSLLGTLMYAYFAVKPPFNVGAFVQILSQFNQNVHPIIAGMFWTAVGGAVLNFGFCVFVFINETKGKKITHASFTSFLLLIVPIVIMYVLFAMTANKVYNLS
jgi:hypothetical protein